MKIEMKKMNCNLLLLLGLQLGLILGCKDFLEPALTNRTLSLIAPADQFVTRSYHITFWWEALEDALSYRLQVVKPDFSRPGSLILDTLIKRKNRFEKTLDPGIYQWRVRAENGSSVSAYTTNSFIVHESSIEEQKVGLKFPLNEFLTNNTALRLGWEKLFGIDDYRIQVDTLNFSDENNLVINYRLSSNEYLFTFPRDGQFQWRVRAELGLEQSRWSEVYTMFLDRTAPAKVIPVAPANQAIVSKPVKLEWQGVPTAKSYRFYVYKSDQVSLYHPSFPMAISGTAYFFNLGDSNEKIYWSVRAIDPAGNEGEMSNLLNFTIQ